MNAQRDAALAYAEAGALVLPLHTPTPGGRRPCSCNGLDCKIGKHPRCMNGKDDATSDIETVARWWSMWPTANIGVRPAEGVVILDVDPRHGGGVTLLNLERRHERLPQTQTVSTGGGGLHIWYALHGPVKGKLGPSGIDIKSNSGYVLMPPSLHESGRSYRWINETAGITPAPQWVAEMLAPATMPLPITTSTASPARAEALAKVVREAPAGDRNNRLFWACARALECGLDLNPLVQAAVSIGLTESEAIRTASSAASRLKVSA